MAVSGAKYQQVFKRYWGMAATAFLVVIASTALGTAIQKPSYLSSADIYIVPKPLTITGNAYVFTDYDYRMLNNQMEILKSDRVALRAAELVALEKEAGDVSKKFDISKDFAVSPAGLQGAIWVEPKDNASVLKISYESQGKPEDIAGVLDVYLKAYMEVLGRLNSEKAAKEKDFLEKQLAKAQEDLEKKAEALKTFQEENRTYNIESEINQLITQQSRLEEQTNTLTAEIASMAKSVKLSRELLPASPAYINFMTRIGEDTEAATLRRNIIDLEAERAEWASKITDAHPKMKAYNVELKRLHKLLSRRLEVFGEEFQAEAGLNLGNITTNSSFDVKLATDVIQSEIELEMLKAKRTILSNSARQIQSMLGDVPSTKLAYATHRAKLDLAQERVKMLEKRLDEAKLVEEMSKRFEDVKILREPVAASAPLKPNFNKNMTAAVLLGLCFAVFAVYARASLEKKLQWSFQLNGVVEREEDLAKAGARIFSLPALPSGQAFEAMMEKSNFVVPEAYKRAVIHLENLAKTEQVRKVGIMPVTPFAGAHMTTIILGLYLTELSNKMVLIDTDYSRFSLSELVASLGLPVSTGIERGPGLSEYLEGQVEDFVDVIYPLGKTVYGSFIPNGHPREAGFQFSHKNMAQLEANLSPNYNFVLYGLTPIEHSYDSIAVGRTLDGVFLVVHPDRTTTDEVHDAVRELKNANCRLLGILFQPEQ